jgi:hypothetical protein
VNDSSTDDGFVTIHKRNGGRPVLQGAVSFNSRTAYFPGDVAAGKPDRVTWAWDGNGTLRARFSEEGELRVFPVGASVVRACSAARVQSAIGRKLAGRYPITRVDGDDVYVDVSGEGGR